MITKTRKPRTNDPLWHPQRAPRVPYVPLTRNLRTDVLIVGGGIAGATIAEALSEAGFDLAMVDRRAPTLGATMASTALV
jgi:heterodisulfide reductase subunit A-like polyferredoxin